MNVKFEQDPHLQLDYVLNMLCSAVKDLNVNKTQVVTIVFKVQDPMDLNDYLYTFSVLGEEEVIEDYRSISSGQEDVEIGNGDYFETAPIFVNKFKFKLKPKVLFKYLVDTSRIPKYTLEFNDIQCRVILNNRYILSEPDFDGVSYVFIDHVINKSRKIIRKEDFSKEAGQKNIGKINKRDFRSIIENILRNTELIKVFFPHISKDSTLFRNDVTTNDLVGQKIKEKNINNFLKTRKTIEHVKSHKDSLKHK